MKFSANLGFLWKDRPLPEAIHAAHDAGFHAVECHWPYEYDPADINAALMETGLSMLGLNTIRGNTDAGENGLSALPTRKDEARAAIDQAIDYARAINCNSIHVMAGFATGTQAHDCFVENLKYACAKASDKTFLIEPLNGYDAPNYFLNSTTQAKQIIQEVNTPNIALMFDCYHIQLLEGDLTRKLRDLLPLIGHIQIASVPDRGTPDHGEIDYQHIFSLLESLGYTKPLGAEFSPKGPTEQNLAWMKS